MLKISSTKSEVYRKGIIKVSSDNKKKYNDKAKFGSSKVNGNKIDNNNIAEEKNH